MASHCFYLQVRLKWLIFNAYVSIASGLQTVIHQYSMGYQAANAHVV